MQISFWLAALVIAVLLDRPLAVALRDSGIAQSIKQAVFWRELAKAPGYFSFTAIVALALALWHRLKWRAAVFIVLCALVSGANAIVKWMVGRFRPFVIEPHDVAQPFRFFPFNGGLVGLFHQKSGLSFVSGHASLAFATAAGIAVLFPRRAALCVAVYGVALMVFAERVLENAHWLSDAVGGAALGVIGVRLLTLAIGPRLLSPRRAAFAQDP
jgi:undecaprenyl-diphosphatase